MQLINDSDASVAAAGQGPRARVCAVGLIPQEGGRQLWPGVGSRGSAVGGCANLSLSLSTASLKRVSQERSVRTEEIKVLREEGGEAIYP